MNGNRFEGEYVDGVAKGKGTMYYADGSTETQIYG